VLLVRLALPIADLKVVENDLDVSTGFRGGTIGEETIGCSALSDVFLKSRRELCLRLHGIHVTDVGSAAKEDLGAGRTVVDSGDVGEDGISHDVLVTARSVHGRVWRAIPSTKMGAHRNSGHLCGAGESFLDSLIVLEKEVGTDAIVVRWLLLDLVFEGEVFVETNVVKETVVFGSIVAIPVRCSEVLVGGPGV
jgi:hypothetical protein